MISACTSHVVGTYSIADPCWPLGGDWLSKGIPHSSVPLTKFGGDNLDHKLYHHFQVLILVNFNLPLNKVAGVTICALACVRLTTLFHKIAKIKCKLKRSKTAKICTR